MATPTRGSRSRAAGAAANTTISAAIVRRATARFIEEFHSAREAMGNEASSKGPRALTLVRERHMGYAGRVTSSDTPSGSPSGGGAAPDRPRKPAPGHHPRWLAHLLRPINRRYGTYRGLIRLWLTHLLLALG